MSVLLKKSGCFPCSYYYAEVDFDCCGISQHYELPLSLFKYYLSRYPKMSKPCSYCDREQTLVYFEH
jgi:hypothetical protein